MVRIVLALLSLLTAHRSAGDGQGRAAHAWAGAAGPYPPRRFGAGHPAAVLAGSGGGPAAPAAPPAVPPADAPHSPPGGPPGWPG